MNVRARYTWVGAIALLVLAWSSLPALAQDAGESASPGSSLGGYRANTAGSAISFRPVFPALLPTGDAPFEVTIALSAATVGSGGNSFGQSSLVYPGSAAANLAPLLKQVSQTADIAPFLPPYPLVVEASAKDGEIIRGAPPALVMRANGRNDRGEGETRISDIKFPGLLEIDEIATISRSLVTATEVMSITETTLTGVRMLSNNITAKSIRSFASTKSNGRTASHDGRTEVTGLVIGGFEATLGADGVHFTGLPSDAEQVPGAQDPFPGQNPDEELTQLLATLGAEIRLTRAAGNEAGGAADSLAQGVFFSIENPIGGVAIPGLNIPVPPGRIEFLLASTAAAVQASPPFEASLPGVTPTDTDADFTSPGTTSEPLVSGDTSGPVLSGGTGGNGLTTAGVDYDFGGLSMGLVLGLLAAAVIIAFYLRRFVINVAALGD